MQNNRAKRLIILVLSLTLFFTALFYLAGAFILKSQKQPMANADLGTWNSYRTYYADNKKVMKSVKMSMFGAFVVCFVFPLVVFVGVTNKRKKLFGDAKFATNSDLAKSVLLKPDPTPKILVGKNGNKFLSFPGEQFVMLAAATRSGKGISTVIPNLLTWPNSVVALDLKLENFQLTSKVRASYGHEVHLWAPFSEKKESSAYNPLAYIRMDENRISDVGTIAESLYPIDTGDKPFWANSSKNLFLAFALYLSETQTLPFTIGEIFRQGSFKGKKPRVYWDEIFADRNFKIVQTLNIESAELVDERHPLSYEEWQSMSPEARNPLPPLSSECVDAVHRFLNNADETLNSIVASFISNLMTWANPIVDAATATNDFDFRDIRKKPMSIYVGIDGEKISEGPAIVNLFFSQLIKINLRTLPEDDPEINQRCLLLLDEFVAPGTIKIIKDANGYMASYWLRPVFIFQGKSQIEIDAPEGYGKHGAQTLVTNSGLRIVHAPDDPKEAKEVSESLGFMTVKNRTVSRSSGKHHNRTTNISDHKRELMLPQEVKELPFEKQFIFMKYCRPILCEKIQFFKEPVFMNRLKAVSPMLAAVGDRLPTRDELNAARVAGELRHQPKKLDMSSRFATRIDPNSQLRIHIEKFMSQIETPKTPTLDELMYDEDGNYILGDEDEADCIARLEEEAGV